MRSISTTQFHRIYKYPLITGVAIAFAGHAVGQQISLSANDAVAAGLQRNPQAIAALAAAEAARASYLSLSVPVPITGGITHVRTNDPSQDHDTLLDVNETLDLSGQRRYQAAGANAQYKAALYQYQETRLSLEQQIRDAYWSLAAARATTSLSQTSLTEAQRVYDLTVKQEQAGASPKSDVLRSSIDVANAKQAVITAQSAERTALIALNTLLARPPDASLELADSLLADAPPPAFPLRDLKELDAQAEANRPLLKSAAEQVNSAKYAIRQAESSRLPDLNLSYERSTFLKMNTYSVGINFPLVDLGSIRESVRSATKLRDQASAQELFTLTQVLQQVSQADSDLRAATDAARSYKRDILDPSVKLLGIVRLGYEQGATGILPIIDAESTIRNARIGYIASLLALYKAEDELVAAVGR